MYQYNLKYVRKPPLQLKTLLLICFTCRTFYSALLHCIILFRHCEILCYITLLAFLIPCSLFHLFSCSPIYFLFFWYIVSICTYLFDTSHILLLHMSPWNCFSTTNGYAWEDYQIISLARIV